MSIYPIYTDVWDIKGKKIIGKEVILWACDL